MCTAGYQPSTEYLCSGRMSLGRGAPEKVTPELKTGTCTAGYERTIEFLYLGRMRVGKRDARKWVSEKREHVIKNKIMSSERPYRKRETTKLQLPQGLHN